MDFARKAITETLHAPMAGLDMTTIRIGRDVYTGLPQGIANGAGGKRWMHIKEPSSSNNSPLAQLLAGTSSASDPGQILRFYPQCPDTVGQGGTMTMTEEFYDFGSPVSITAPPASQTRTLQLKLPSTKPSGCATS